MEIVRFFLPDQNYLEQVKALYELHCQEILQALPKAQVEHVGATSVPGLLTKGDLDLQVSVSEQDFTEAVVTLRSIYAIHQPENWTGSFASFKLSQDAEIPVGIQLVVQCSADDVFVKIRNLLVARPETVKELNLLKQSYDGGDMSRYVEQKGAFFTSLLQANTDSG
jgi:GrpB-like predicted nucleotidyltransferase (UPF0157 family)